MNIETPYGYVYRITNLVNGKTYVGRRKLCLDNYWRHYLGSGNLIINAVRKYGEENFVKSLVCYSFSLKDLAEKEMFNIENEILSGGGQYNIYGTKEAFSRSLKSNSKMGEEILKLFFNEWKTYGEIAKTVNLTLPQLCVFIKTKSKTDFRFEKLLIEQKKRRRLVLESPKSTIFANIESVVKTHCFVCKKDVSYNNFSRHIKSVSHNFALNKSFVKTCEKGNCDTPIAVKSKYCIIHCRDDIPKEDFNKNFKGKEKTGGLIASHNRWHVNRGINSPDCAFCIRDLN